VKVFVFDLDGTVLVNSQIAPDVKKLLKRLSQSYIVIFASGRMFSSILKVMRNFDLDGIIVAYNGSYIFLKDEIKTYCINPKDAAAVIDFLRALKVHRQVYVDDVLYVEEKNEFAMAYSQQSGVEFHVTEDLKETIKNGCIFKILAYDTPENVRKIKDQASECDFGNVDLFTSSESYLEFVRKGINKKVAIEFLAQKMGFSLSEVIAFGDGENDAELLSAAGMSFAMFPGNEKSLTAGSKIIDNLDGRGILRAFKVLKYSHMLEER
jgi:Cof subfamily protein (haloacid dehalogenase superfamily)